MKNTASEESYLAAHLKFSKIHFFKENIYENNIFWLDDTKMELCSLNSHHHAWTKQNKEFMPKNTILTVMHRSAMLDYAIVFFLIWYRTTSHNQRKHEWRLAAKYID